MEQTGTIIAVMQAQGGTSLQCVAPAAARRAQRPAYQPAPAKQEEKDNLSF